MIYKQYVKGKRKFTKHNPMGTLIGQNKKNWDKIAKKEKMMTINTKIIPKKKKMMMIKTQSCAIFS